MSAQPPPPGGGQPLPPGQPPPPAGHPPPPWGSGPATPRPPGGGVPPGSQLTWDVAAGVRWAWEAFLRSPAAWVGITLGVVALAFLPLVPLLFTMREPTVGPGTTVAVILLAVAVGVVSFVVAIGLYRAGLEAVDRRPVTFGTFLRLDRLGAVLGTLLLVSLGSLVGMLLCILPGIVFAFMAMWAPLFALDGHGPVEAVKRSLSLTRQRWADAVVAWLVVQVIVLAGMLALGVGLFVAYPVYFLLLAWVYRNMVAHADLSRAPGDA